ncbi:hypothetical protein B0H11DRAFT_2197568 [Mycena galericulata]|nr:hypothetical protein B0H11DRAFT_2197568 [Mycena galericulata]
MRFVSITLLPNPDIFVSVCLFYTYGTNKPQSFSHSRLSSLFSAESYLERRELKPQVGEQHSWQEVTGSCSSGQWLTPNYGRCRGVPRGTSRLQAVSPGCIDDRLVLWMFKISVCILTAPRRRAGIPLRHGFLRETAPLCCAHDERRIVELVVIVLRGQRATRRNIRHQITLTTSHSVAYNNPNLTAWAAYALPAGRQRTKLRRRSDIDANREADESACQRVRSARWPQLTRRPPDAPRRCFLQREFSDTISAMFLITRRQCQYGLRASRVRHPYAILTAPLDRLHGGAHHTSWVSMQFPDALTCSPGDRFHDVVTSLSAARCGA